MGGACQLLRKPEEERNSEREGNSSLAQSKILKARAFEVYACKKGK